MTAESERSDERRHIQQVVELVDEMQRRAPTEFEAVLRDINIATAESVPGAQYACVTVIEHDGGVRSLAATHQYPILLDDIQRDTREGPCLSAAWDHDTVTVADLNAETRWPDYRRAALAAAPVRSIVSIRMFGDGTRLSALNLYADAPGAFDEESVELGLIFAAHTSVAWNMMRRQQQFRSALASRDLIGQAKGILMERFGIEAFAAFDLLRRLSQDSNVRLADIAEKIVADHSAG